MSIIIPAYNEEKRLAVTLDKIRGYLENKNFDFEVIVVDDGSKDRTVAVSVKSLLFKEGNLKVLRNAENRGKGFSVRQGILNSKGEFVLFSDADLSTPIQELDKLYEYIKSGFDFVIGSRSLGDSDVQVRQPWVRERMGKVFNYFVKLLLVSGFSDTQCGFKLLRREVAYKIASLSKIDGFCFDVEMLYLARKLNYKVKEVGVIWLNSVQSKVRVLGSSFDMFKDLLRIKAMHKCIS
ncbi:MAG: glycosyltransferase family 2 protein [Candidatus Omnitrophica bacterium]|nr:glycosyltransferase family 2 protein [Candidatus Omnitrophota bacterium]